MRESAMMEDALRFWNAIRGKVDAMIGERTGNCLRCERYDVSRAPDGSVMGVRRPYGAEILLPYCQQVAEAEVGDTVLVVWRGGLSNGKVWCYGNGPE